MGWTSSSHMQILVGISGHMVTGDKNDAQAAQEVQCHCFAYMLSLIGFPAFF